MEAKLVNVRAGGPEYGPGENAILDPLTQYPIEIWEQKTMIPGQRVFMLMFYRRARWHRGSPQMLDRNLRRFGLPPLSDAPWGPGAELSDWAEDLVEPLSQEEAVHLVEQLDAERGR